MRGTEGVIDRKMIGYGWVEIDGSGLLRAKETELLAAALNRNRSRALDVAPHVVALKRAIANPGLPCFLDDHQGGRGHDEE